MSSKTMYMLQFHIQSLDYNVETVAVSSQLKNLKVRAQKHIDEMNEFADPNEVLSLSKWKNNAGDQSNPIFLNHKDSQDMSFTIVQVEKV